MIAVAALGAVCIMLLILLPFGYFAMQECNGVCSGDLEHCYGCIDALRPFSLIATFCVCTAL